MEKHATHIKPHGALNNMACEDIELATTLAKAINEISKELIYLVPTGSKMEEAAKKLNMKIAQKYLLIETMKTMAILYQEKTSCINH